MVRELRPALVAVDIHPGRLEAWANLVALEADLSRGGTPLVLFAAAAGSGRGVAASFERLLHAPVSGDELVRALELSTPETPRSGPRSRPAFSARGACWLAAGERNAPPELDVTLRAAGFDVQRPTSQNRGQAQAAGGDYAAVAVDLADRVFGGFELAVELQAGRSSELAWIALVPGELTSSERKRLIEYVEGAVGSVGAAVAAAAIRVTREVPAVRRPRRDDQK